MDQKTRERLLQDYHSVNKGIEEILRQGKNYFVLDPDYITPTVNLKDPVSMDSQQGKYSHLQKVRSILETALIYGEVQAEMSIDLTAVGAPNYLKDLLN